MTDERVLAWERFFRAASTKEEREHLWELAKTSDELGPATAGFLRTTHLEER